MALASGPLPDFISREVEGSNNGLRLAHCRQRPPISPCSERTLVITIRIAASPASIVMVSSGCAGVHHCPSCARACTIAGLSGSLTQSRDGPDRQESRRRSAGKSIGSARCAVRRRDLLAGRYPSNVDTVASVSLSGSNSPSRASSKILTATSSTRGVEPVSSNRAQAYLNARFIASRRSSSLNVVSPARLALCGYYRRPNCRECKLFHTRVRAHKNPT
jgi:hypothetical protein